MSKRKSKKKQSFTKRIRGNAKAIVIVAVVVTIFSGLSFYLGVATPRSYTIPINLSSTMVMEISYSASVNYAPAHTGVRISFEVTSNSHSWTLAINKMDGTPLDQLSGSVEGAFSTDTWLYAPEGCRIYIRSSSTIPSSISLDGTLTITSSRFPFI